VGTVWSVLDSGESPLKRLVFCLLAVVLLAVAPGTATADTEPGATNTRYDYLDPSPAPNAATAWVSRDIFLEEGTYDWKVIVHEDNSFVYLEAERDIILEEGTYHWRCYADPTNDGQYVFGCILDHPGDPSAGLAGDPTPMIGGLTQNFTWGGWLTKIA